jgi:hypothetical protein
MSFGEPAQHSDPTVAVILERLATLSGDLKDHRDEIKADFVSMNERIGGIEETQANQAKMLNRAQGGYMVLLGIGSLAAFVVGFYEKIAKLWTA